MNVLLSTDQQAKLLAAVGDLTSQQLVWASGYLAGLAEGRAGGAAPASAEAAASVAQVTVLYGTETGHARGLAQRVAEKLGDRGITARAVDMEEYKTRDLKSETNLVVVTATHGEGDPPDPARPFFEFLMGRKAPKLDGVNFAVLALGDSSYEFFCKTGKDIDARLETLGGRRALERLDCDVDFETPAADWIDRLVTTFTGLVEVSAPVDVRISTPAGSISTAALASAEAPRDVAMVGRVNLNGRGSGKATYHIEFSLEGSGLAYQPGDALGVLVENDPALVEEIVDTLELGGNGVAEALRKEYELTILTPAFLEAYAQVSGAEPLLTTHQAGDRESLRSYMEDRQIADVVREFPARGISAEQFTGMLRRLTPRLYSIASSLEACPDEVHLVVADVTYQSPMAPRSGVASGYLNHRLEDGAVVRAYIEPNHRFRLPDDPATPILMIGAGTGVAPYRAFLQEREVRGIPGRSWLFFGDRHFRTDFLYQIEWQQFLKEGYLTRMDVAFSRDQANKVYVQHRLLERGAEVFAWLEEGAHVYVCGDAKKMAPDVHQALLDIIATHGGRDEEAAREYLSELTAQKRYKRDVY